MYRIASACNDSLKAAVLVIWWILDVRELMVRTMGTTEFKNIYV